MALTTYNPKDLSILYSVKDLGGNIFAFLGPDAAPGTFLTVQPDTDLWDTVTGVNGKVVRIENLNNSGLITIFLFAGSPASDFLATVARADIFTNRGKGILTVSLKRTTPPSEDLKEFKKKQRSFIVADNCWVKAIPKMSFGEEAPVIEWVLQSEELKVLPMYLDPDTNFFPLVE